MLYFLTVTSQSKVLEEVGMSHSQLLREHPIVTAAVRVLGAWLAEDSLTLAAEVYKLLPFLLEFCVDSTPIGEEGGSDDDLLKFLLPGLCHMTADDQSRCILLKTRLLNTLSCYMEKLLPMCKKSRYTNH